ncbi:MAG: presenilin family intramembrane aspartyl protease [Candidatus Pacearchaeota archaeon]
MKHNIQITMILIGMFLITQLIGLAVIYAYTPQVEQIEINGTVQNVTINPLPYNLEQPEVDKRISFVSILFAFIIAIFFVFILTKIRAAVILRYWFFFVVTIVLGIVINAILMQFINHNLLINDFSIPIASTLAILLALPLAVYKIFKRNIYVHNITELLIYPGIAVVLIPLLNLWTIVILLLIISLYDIWAVWHSGFMQKMAHFQINELKIFGGFFVPYLNKKQRAMIREARLKKSRYAKMRKLKKMKINLAILGGGDIVFPIITAGVVIRDHNFSIPLFGIPGLLSALIVVFGATFALSLLFFYSKKGKFYPAMPFITAGLLLGILISSFLR